MEIVVLHAESFEWDDYFGGTAAIEDLDLPAVPDEFDLDPELGNGELIRMHLQYIDSAYGEGAVLARYNGMSSNGDDYDVRIHASASHCE